jgi:DNA invertase Pin-like site-specific DNA recombinase
MVLREGDELVVTRIDRLPRLKDRGINLRATEQPIDASTAAGKCLLDMLGVFAEFETNLRCERQREGIEEAKERSRACTQVGVRASSQRVCAD